MIHKKAVVYLLLSLVCFCSTEPSLVSGENTTSTFQITVDQVIASGFIHPVQVTHAGDGSGRLFVVEQPGTIRIIKDGTVLSTPFLDITELTNDSGEQGLLGMAFHPEYPNNGYVYVDYTRASDGTTVVARYIRSGTDPNRLDPDSAQTVLTVDQPYSNHNGGQILFGPDDYLYIGLGDGGSGGDPLENAQDPTEILGSILRIDVDNGDPYAIPGDNPYVGTSGRDEIWAIGLRNPWRFSCDRETGDVYIGDVGQNAWEEIDFYPAWGSADPGAPNFGWDCLEGTHPYEWDDLCEERANLFIDPIAEYSHDVGRSVTGGFVYRGGLYPDLEGRYFYADYVSGRIWSVAPTQSGFAEPKLELDTELNISAFGEDEDGELYVVGRGGSIRRLADADGPAPPADLTGSTKRPSPPAADLGDVITYTITISNAGRAVDGTVTMTDTVPAGLTYLTDSLTATSGDPDDSEAPTLIWTGTVLTNTTVRLTYQVAPNGTITGSLVNYAILGAPHLEPVRLASAVFTPRSQVNATMQDLLLPGTQPSTLHAEIPPSVDCDICHSAPVYDAWRGTMMSQSARDPVMRAALATANADAGFTPDAVAGDYCLRCHAPKGWLEGRSHPPDGSALNAQDVANGIACEVCHRMVDPRSTGGELVDTDLQIREALTMTVPISYTGSATLIVDPDDNRRGPFMFDPNLSYHSAYQTDFLGQTSDAVTRSRLCGSCHNVDNPLLSWDDGRGEFWPNATDAPPEVAPGALFPIERTFTEWLYSDYPTGVVAPQFAGTQSDDTVAACQDCHLQRQTGTAADPQFDPVPRDCETTGCLPEHQMVGGNAWVPDLLQDPTWRLSAAEDSPHLDATAYAATTMLRRAATLTATLTASGTQKVAIVRVTNQTGHKLPTGYPEGRQMWLHVRAYDAVGDLVFESGRYDPETRRLIRDDPIKVYEAKQGLSDAWAQELQKPPGATFHFLLNNTVVKDNRIPPRGYDARVWDEPGLRPVGATYADGQHWDETVYALPDNAARITAALYYQTASREYVEFLKANGGVDGEVLYDLWTRTPSPPVLMAAYPWYEVWMPIVTKTWSPR